MNVRSRRTLLRDRTAAAHASLDGTIGGFDDLEAYKAYLHGMSAFRLPVEHALAGLAWPDRLAPFDTETIGDLILSDLADLDMNPAPPPAPPVIARTPEAMLGLLYVLEGSALGARLLYRRARALGLTESFGARHLAAQAATTDRWPRFLALLEAAEPIEIDRVAETSTAAFHLAEKAFKSAFHAA